MTHGRPTRDSTAAQTVALRSHKATKRLPGQSEVRARLGHQDRRTANMSSKVVNGLAHALGVTSRVRNPSPRPRWATEEMTRDHASSNTSMSLEAQYKKMQMQKGAWG